MQTTPLLAGLGVAASALVAQRAATAYAAWRTAPMAMRRFYEGGFEASMSRREAALILGVRQSATEEKVKSAQPLFIYGLEGRAKGALPEAGKWMLGLPK